MGGRGGVPLAFCRWEHPSPKGRVVISHGYGEHGERYRHTACWLHGLGWSVSAMDHMGFGRSGGPRGDATGIRGFVEDFQSFLYQERHQDALGGRAPRLPQVVLGHSFGGLVALLALLWHPGALDGLVLSSPVLRLRPLPLRLRILQLLLGLVAPHRALDLPGDKGLVCSDPVMVQRYWEDPHCHHWVTAAFPRALAEGARALSGMGGELDRPILLLEAGLDTVADPDAAPGLWEAVPEGLLERYRLAGFRHEILHDIRRGTAQEIVASWLRRVPGNPAAPSAMSV